MNSVTVPSSPAAPCHHDCGGRVAVRLGTCAPLVVCVAARAPSASALPASALLSGSPAVPLPDISAPSASAPHLRLRAAQRVPRRPLPAAVRSDGESPVRGAIYWHCLFTATGTGGPAGGGGGQRMALSWGSLLFTVVLACCLGDVPAGTSDRQWCNTTCPDHARALRRVCVRARSRCLRRVCLCTRCMRARPSTRAHARAIQTADLALGWSGGVITARKDRRPALLCCCCAAGRGSCSPNTMPPLVTPPRSYLRS